jgi:hypothetical protein
MNKPKILINSFFAVQICMMLTACDSSIPQFGYYRTLPIEWVENGEDSDGVGLCNFACVEMWQKYRSEHNGELNGPPVDQYQIFENVRMHYDNPRTLKSISLWVQQYLPRVDIRYDSTQAMNKYIFEKINPVILPGSPTNPLPEPAMAFVHGVDVAEPDYNPKNGHMVLVNGLFWDSNLRTATKISIVDPNIPLKIFSNYSYDLLSDEWSNWFTSETTGYSYAFLSDPANLGRIGVDFERFNPVSAQ